VFEGHHYQNAYICDDIDAEIAKFRQRADIKDVKAFDISMPAWTPEGMKNLSTRLAFIWIGDLQYELIQVVEDESGIYSNYTSNGGTLHFHHICTRVDDWDSFRERVRQQDLPVVLERANEGDELKYLYLDARSVCGHYLEYTWMTDARWEQLRAM
jgi:hypothetical protein